MPFLSSFEEVVPVYEIAFYNAEGKRTFTFYEEILPVAISKAFTELTKPGTLWALREMVTVYDFENGEKLYEETQLTKAFDGKKLPEIEGVGLDVYNWKGEFKYALWEPEGPEARATLLSHYKVQIGKGLVVIGGVEAHFDYDSCFCHHCKHQEFRLAYAGNMETPPEYDSVCKILKKKTEEDFCEGLHFEEVKT